MAPLVHVAYASECIVEMNDYELRALVERSRRRNARRDVSGILLLAGRSFFQILEGPPTAVGPLFETISRDERHRRVVKLIDESIDHRDFGDWSMGLLRSTKQLTVSMPGFNDFFASPDIVEQLGEGIARNLLDAFRRGRLRIDWKTG